MIRNTRISRAIAAACCFVSVAGAAFAAAPDASTTSDSTSKGPAAGGETASATSEPIRLEEVVVTAEKRSERAIDVPLSVTALDAADLATNGYDQLKDYFDEVPGLSVSARGKRPYDSRATRNHYLQRRQSDGGCHHR